VAILPVLAVVRILVEMVLVAAAVKVLALALGQVAVPGLVVAPAAALVAAPAAAQALVQAVALAVAAVVRVAKVAAREAEAIPHHQTTIPTMMVSLMDMKALLVY
jgi:hypothetical protein